MGKKRTKQRQLEMAVAGIQQRYGSLALVRGRTPTNGIGATVVVPHISTGFASLDQALGIGGLARGRVSEILGPATSGKTTLVLKLLAQAQADGGQVGYVDYAHSFDPDYAYRCGLDLSRLLVAVPYDLGEALAITEALATSGALSALVFDGPDVLWSDAGAAPLLTACLDRMITFLARAGTVVLFLHSPMDRGSLGLSALAHHATVRLHIARERWLRHHSDIRGYEAKVEILKNRLGPAGRAVTVAIKFNGTVRGNGL
jgi:recombination protein RecA